MLQVKQENLSSLTVDLVLTDQQRAVLYAFVQQEGFHVIQQLMEEEIRKMHVHHMNTDVADTERQQATFLLAKAAAMFYSGFISSLSGQMDLQKYNAAKLGTLANPEPSATVIEY